MASRPRVTVAIGADVHERLKAEAEARTLSVTRLAEILIERGLAQLEPVPTVDVPSRRRG